MEKFKSYTIIISVLIIVLLVIFNLNTCNRLKVEKLEKEKQQIMYENNLVAMKDSIKTFYDKTIDSKVYEKTAYLVNSFEDLKKYNMALYKDLKDIKNSVAGISSDVNILIDSLVDKSTIQPLDSNTFRIPWNFSYNDIGLSQKIKGRTEFKVINNEPYPLYSYLDVSEIDVKLKYNFIEEDNKYKIWASSPSDKIKFTELDGVLLLDRVLPDPKIVNRWSFGPSLFVGLTTDYKAQNPRIGYGVGISVNYNLFAKIQGKKKIKDWLKKDK